jgi:glycosyltransferase involved in cell wall biosynthesis
MKILLLADPSSIHVKRWANSLCRKGIAVFIFGFSSFDRSEYLNEIIIDSINISHERINHGNIFQKIIYLKSFFYLRKILNSFKPDIVHAHYASSYGLLGRALNFHPFIISVWGSDVFDFPQRSFFLKKILEYNLSGADKILSTSQVMRDELKKYTDKKVEVTPFGIDINMFKPICKTYVSDKPIVIGTVKSLEEIYGIQYLIKAFKIIKDKYPDNNIKLLIIGEGSYETELKNLCSKLEVENDVEFTGKKEYEKLEEYYNKLDIAVFLSKSESFGVAVLEASACEKPVVVSNVGGLPEVVEDNVTGFIVEKENPDDAAASMEKLIFNENLRKEMGSNGRKRVEQFYNWNNNVDQMIKIYENILKDFKWKNRNQKKK